MSERRRAALFGLVTLIVGCSSDSTSGDPGGSTSSSGSTSVGGVTGSGAGVTGNATSGAGLGSIGTGPVACAGASEGSCPAGSVCCARFTGAADTCADSYEACTDGLPLGCDDPTDCPGQKCCAKKPPGPGTATHYGSGCKSACDPT